MRRFLFIATAALALGACDSSSTPTQPLSPTAASRDEVTPPSDTTCRSGWSVANGRC